MPYEAYASIKALTVIDLTHPILEDMPVYPGTEPPTITTPFTIEKDHFTEKKIIFSSHTGTHIDAPAHIITGAPTLDELPITQFIGDGLVVDVSANRKNEIEKSELISYQLQLEKVEFLLLHTGWSQRWGKAGYFEGYPVLTIEAAAWLAQFPLKGIGVDAISLDPINELRVHRVVLTKPMIIIENLTGLDQLLGRSFLFSCFPLKLPMADGSPVRAIAMNLS